MRLIGREPQRSLVVSEQIVHQRRGAGMAVDKRGVRAFIRDLKGKPAIHAGIAGQNSRQVSVNVEGEMFILTANEWDSLPVWGGPLPAGVVSRYL
jgi:hypothetical protein